MRFHTIVLLALFPFLPGVVHAHRLVLFATRGSSGIVGRAFFSGGSPAAGIPVRAQDASRRRLAEVRTDRQGRFFIAGLPAGSLVLVGETADGHLSEFRLSAGDEHAPGVAQGSAAVAGQSSSRMAQIEALLQRLETRIYLRDILGGIGYIAGVWGTWALVLARRAGGRGARAAAEGDHDVPG
ncbi:MAG TPA: carboxypeptidase regulatory-like domain-containing protein [Kiritimatiellae bacterium]|nr:carboxypeptidase regulatory-like domain-containing protein [Kiritimatiellia bacterium]